MESSVHGHDFLPAQMPEDQFPGMAFYRRDREMRNILIGNFISISDLGSKLSQACSQDDGYLWVDGHPLS